MGAKWFGFGLPSGVGAYRWNSCCVARAFPAPDKRAELDKNPGKYVVTLKKRGGSERTMPLDEWRSLPSPGNERVVTVLNKETGALIPRRRIPARLKNGPVVRVLRHVWGVRNLKRIRWPDDGADHSNSV